MDAEVNQVMVKAVKEAAAVIDVSAITAADQQETAAAVAAALNVKAVNHQQVDVLANKAVYLKITRNNNNLESIHF